MTKRLVDIDDEVLQAAREALATTTLKDTVNHALAEAVALHRRRAHLRRLSEDGLPDLRSDRVRADAWR